MWPNSRLSAFPDSNTEWRVESFCPDYSGGTVPDLHRLPYYALAGTQDIAKPSSTVQSVGCQWDQNNFNLFLDARCLDENESIFRDGRDGQHTTTGT
jgi:hypothetical protein